MRQLFFLFSASNVLSKDFNFPAEKIRWPKYACAVFFFFKQINGKKNSSVVVSLSSFIVLQSINKYKSTRLSLKVSREKMFKYILKLLAGKFKIFRRAFPLATIAQKNFRRVSLENFPSQKITSRKDDKRWLKVKWQAIKTTDFLLEIRPKQFLIFRLCVMINFKFCRIYYSTWKYQLFL